MADNYMDNIQMGKDEDAESFALHDVEAREKIEELDGLIAEAKDLINTLQTTQERMQSTLSTAQANITDNTTAISTNKSDIATINNSLSEITSTIDKAFILQSAPTGSSMDDLTESGFYFANTNIFSDWLFSNGGGIVLVFNAGNVSNAILQIASNRFGSFQFRYYWDSSWFSWISV